jgi:hypothetical protein
VQGAERCFKHLGEGKRGTEIPRAKNVSPSRNDFFCYRIGLRRLGRICDGG